MTTRTDRPKKVPNYDMVIIGAGIAGLAAGRLARKAGLSVLVVDKGQRLGGRVATRRHDNFVFNHGAQYVTAKTPDFIGVLRSAEQAGKIAEWQIRDKKRVYVGMPMMRSLPMFLASGLDIYQQLHITKIRRDRDLINCFDADAQVITARQVICTAPAPQTTELLADDFPDLAATASTVRYAPCITVMLGLKKYNLLPHVPVCEPQHNIGWAMLENLRPGASQNRPALTIQADPDWSAANINEAPTQLIVKLKAKYQQATGGTIGEVVHADVHRWLFAKTITTAASDSNISQNNVAIAGDWLEGARVENAFTSGQRAFNALQPSNP